jgi:hypothetical protein
MIIMINYINNDDKIQNNLNKSNINKLNKNNNKKIKKMKDQVKRKITILKRRRRNHINS